MTRFVIAGRARAAVCVLFLVNGFVWATWVAEIPSVQARLGLGPAALGATLLCAAAGGVAGLLGAGRWVDRVGGRRLATAAGLGLCVLLPLAAFAPGPWGLRAALLLFGAANGLLDVSMNAEAVVVEEEAGRPRMSSFHGLFSLGGWLGASVATAGMAAGVPDPARVLACAALLAASVALASPSLPPPRLAPPRAMEDRGARLPPALAGLGACTFLALMGEGAVGDWSAVYLRTELRLSAATAAQGFAAFSLAMAAARFAGDTAVRRFGAGAVLRTSAALGALGLGLGLLAGRPAPALLGFACAGLGLANAVPLLFGAAGRVGGVSSGQALASVSASGYLGYLVGPPLIGLLAEHASLGSGLGLVAVGCALIALLGGALVGARAGRAAQVST